MNKKAALANSLIALILLGGLSAFAYYRTKINESCDTILKKYKENTACINTSRGIMVYELYPTSALKSIQHFKDLANNKKFYDGLEFYRIAKGFVAQAGIQDFQQQNSDITKFNDPVGDKVKYQDVKLDTESNFDKLNFSDQEKGDRQKEGFASTPDLDTKPFEYGMLSFANAGPGTNSTEIFVVTAKDQKSENVRYLDGRFTPMGKIVQGQSVLDNMNDSELDKNYPYSKEKPLSMIKIFEVRVQ